MAKARRIRLEARIFEKAGDGTAFFSAMLNSYSLGDKISEADSLDLGALLNRHNEREEKIGVGVDYFEVEAAPDSFSGRCFWIVRKDGSRIDFSLRHCLCARPCD
jgi:hypothetical protein